LNFDGNDLLALDDGKDKYHNISTADGSIISSTDVDLTRCSFNPLNTYVINQNFQYLNQGDQCIFTGY